MTVYSQWNLRLVLFTEIKPIKYCLDRAATARIDAAATTNDRQASVHSFIDRQLPGHGSIVHDLSSELSPAHAAPPR